MSRRALSIGEHGEIEVTPQRRDPEGRWKRASSSRAAERWRGRAYYRGPDGLVRDVSRVAPSKRDAQRAVEVALQERRDPGDLRLTVTTPFLQVGELWLKQIARSDSGLSGRTITEYTYMFRRHIDARHSLLRGLTLGQANDPQRLRAFQERLADDAGTSSAKMTRSVLSGILNLAVDHGVLTANAMRQVRPVRSQKAGDRQRDHRRAFTREERTEVVAFADKRALDENVHPSTARKRRAVADLVAFMAGTGVRISEASHLRWEHVNLEQGYADIHGTKSRASRRRLWLPPWLIERLSQRAELSAVGLVFPSPHHVDGSERVWDQSNLQKAVRALLDDAGLNWAVPHTFRRTVATLLSGAGVPLVEIADQLGHANPAMTASVYLGRDFMGERRGAAQHL